MKACWKLTLWAFLNSFLLLVKELFARLWFSMRAKSMTLPQTEVVNMQFHRSRIQKTKCLIYDRITCEWFTQDSCSKECQHELLRKQILHSSIKIIQNLLISHLINHQETRFLALNLDEEFLVVLIFLVFQEGNDNSKERPQFKQ